MMAMSEQRDGADRAVNLKTIAFSVLLGAVALFAFGAATGVAGRMLEVGANWKGATMVGAFLGIAGCAMWGLARLKPWARSDEPVSPKTRKANTLLLISGALGGVMGGVLALSTLSLDDPFALFSNVPIPALVAAAMIVLWLVVLPPLYWAWFRAADEHELKAYNYGGLAALHLYYFILPAWWIGWRGGFFPSIDHGAIFALVTVVWCMGWFWRRYR